MSTAPERDSGGYTPFYQDSSPEQERTLAKQASVYQFAHSIAGQSFVENPPNPDISLDYQARTNLFRNLKDLFEQKILEKKGHESYDQLFNPPIDLNALFCEQQRIPSHIQPSPLPLIQPSLASLSLSATILSTLCQENKEFTSIVLPILDTAVSSLSFTRESADSSFTSEILLKNLSSLLSPSSLNIQTPELIDLSITSLLSLARTTGNISFSVAAADTLSKTFDLSHDPRPIHQSLESYKNELSTCFYEMDNSKTSKTSPLSPISPKINNVMSIATDSQTFFFLDQRLVISKLTEAQNTSKQLIYHDKHWRTLSSVVPTPTEPSQHLRFDLIGIQHPTRLILVAPHSVTRPCASSNSTPFPLLTVIDPDTMEVRETITEGPGSTGRKFVRHSLASNYAQIAEHIAALQSLFPSEPPSKLTPQYLQSCGYVEYSRYVSDGTFLFEITILLHDPTRAFSPESVRTPSLSILTTQSVKFMYVTVYSLYSPNSVDLVSSFVLTFTTGSFHECSICETVSYEYTTATTSDTIYYCPICTASLESKDKIQKQYKEITPGDALDSPPSSQKELIKWERIGWDAQEDDSLKPYEEHNLDPFIVCQECYVRGNTRPHCGRLESNTSTLGNPLPYADGKSTRTRHLPSHTLLPFDSVLQAQGKPAHITPANFERSYLIPVGTFFLFIDVKGSHMMHTFVIRGEADRIRSIVTESHSTGVLSPPAIPTELFQTSIYSSQTLRDGLLCYDRKRKSIFQLNDNWTLQQSTFRKVSLVPDLDIYSLSPELFELDTALALRKAQESFGKEPTQTNHLLLTAILSSLKEKAVHPFVTMHTSFPPIADTTVTPQTLLSVLSSLNSQLPTEMLSTTATHISFNVDVSLSMFTSLQSLLTFHNTLAPTLSFNTDTLSVEASSFIQSLSMALELLIQHLISGSRQDICFEQDNEVFDKIHTSLEQLFKTLKPLLNPAHPSSILLKSLLTMAILISSIEYRPKLFTSSLQTLSESIGQTNDSSLAVGMSSALLAPCRHTYGILNSLVDVLTALDNPSTIGSTFLTQLFKSLLLPFPKLPTYSFITDSHSPSISLLVLIFNTLTLQSIPGSSLVTLAVNLIKSFTLSIQAIATDTKSDTVFATFRDSPIPLLSSHILSLVGTLLKSVSAEAFSIVIEPLLQFSFTLNNFISFLPPAWHAQLSQFISVFTHKPLFTNSKQHIMHSSKSGKEDVTRRVIHPSDVPSAVLALTKSIKSSTAPFSLFLNVKNAAGYIIVATNTTRGSFQVFETDPASRKEFNKIDSEPTGTSAIVSFESIDQFASNRGPQLGSFSELPSTSFTLLTQLKTDELFANSDPEDGETIMFKLMLINTSMYIPMGDTALPHSVITEFEKKVTTIATDGSDTVPCEGSSVCMFNDTQKCVIVNSPSCILDVKIGNVEDGEQNLFVVPFYSTQTTNYFSSVRSGSTSSPMDVSDTKPQSSQPALPIKEESSTVTLSDGQQLLALLRSSLLITRTGVAHDPNNAVQHLEILQKCVSETKDIGLLTLHPIFLDTFCSIITTTIRSVRRGSPSNVQTELEHLMNLICTLFSACMEQLCTTEHSDDTNIFNLVKNSTDLLSIFNEQSFLNGSVAISQTQSQILSSILSSISLFFETNSFQTINVPILLWTIGKFLFLVVEALPSLPDRKETIIKITLKGLSYITFFTHFLLDRSDTKSLIFLTTSVPAVQFLKCVEILIQNGIPIEFSDDDVNSLITDLTTLASTHPLVLVCERARKLLAAIFVFIPPLQSRTLSPFQPHPSAQPSSLPFADANQQMIELVASSVSSSESPLVILSYFPQEMKRVLSFMLIGNSAASTPLHSIFHSLFAPSINLTSFTTNPSQEQLQSFQASVVSTILEQIDTFQSVFVILTEESTALPYSEENSALLQTEQNVLDCLNESLLGKSVLFEHVQAKRPTFVETLLEQFVQLAAYIKQTYQNPTPKNRSFNRSLANLHIVMSSLVRSLAASFPDRTKQFILAKNASFVENGLKSLPPFLTETLAATISRKGDTESTIAPKLSPSTTTIQADIPTIPEILQDTLIASWGLSEEHPQSPVLAPPDSPVPAPDTSEETNLLLQLLRGLAGESFDDSPLIARRERMQQQSTAERVTQPTDKRDTSIEIKASDGSNTFSGSSAAMFIDALNTIMPVCFSHCKKCLRLQFVRCPACLTPLVHPNQVSQKENGDLKFTCDNCDKDFETLGQCSCSDKIININSKEADVPFVFFGLMHKSEMNALGKWLVREIDDKPEDRNDVPPHEKRDYDYQIKTINRLRQEREDGHDLDCVLLHDPNTSVIRVAMHGRGNIPLKFNFQKDGIILEDYEREDPKNPSETICESVEIPPSAFRHPILPFPPQHYWSLLSTLTPNPNDLPAFDMSSLLVNSRPINVTWGVLPCVVAVSDPFKSSWVRYTSSFDFRKVSMQPREGKMQMGWFLYGTPLSARSLTIRFHLRRLLSLEVGGMLTHADTNKMKQLKDQLDRYVGTMTHTQLLYYASHWERAIPASMQSYDENDMNHPIHALMQSSNKKRFKRTEAHMLTQFMYTPSLIFLESTNLRPSSSLDRAMGIPPLQITASILSLLDLRRFHRTLIICPDYIHFPMAVARISTSGHVLALGGSSGVDAYKRICEQLGRNPLKGSTGPIDFLRESASSTVGAAVPTNFLFHEGHILSLSRSLFAFDRIYICSEMDDHTLLHALSLLDTQSYLVRRLQRLNGKEEPYNPTGTHEDDKPFLLFANRANGEVKKFIPNTMALEEKFKNKTPKGRPSDTMRFYSYRPNCPTYIPQLESSLVAVNGIGGPAKIVVNPMELSQTSIVPLLQLSAPSAQAAIEENTHRSICMTLPNLKNLLFTHISTDTDMIPSHVVVPQILREHIGRTRPTLTQTFLHPPSQISSMMLWTKTETLWGMIVTDQYRVCQRHVLPHNPRELQAHDAWLTVESELVAAGQSHPAYEPTGSHNFAIASFAPRNRVQRFFDTFFLECRDCRLHGGEGLCVPCLAGSHKAHHHTKENPADYHSNHTPLRVSHAFCDCDESMEISSSSRKYECTENPLNPPVSISSLYPNSQYRIQSLPPELSLSDAQKEKKKKAWLDRWRTYDPTFDVFTPTTGPPTKGQFIWACPTRGILPPHFISTHHASLLTRQDQHVIFAGQLYDDGLYSEQIEVGPKRFPGDLSLVEGMDSVRVEESSSSDSDSDSGPEKEEPSTKPTPSFDSHLSLGLMSLLAASNPNEEERFPPPIQPWRQFRVLLYGIVFLAVLFNLERLVPLYKVPFVIPLVKRIQNIVAHIPEILLFVFLIYYLLLMLFNKLLTPPLTSFDIVNDEEALKSKQIAAKTRIMRYETDNIPILELNERMYGI
ncbi:hypothetical protein BLNAU_2816 [Blattamonas nauphoetae]|uniref:HECT domain-containing protein n=1 Tax=Blattamonas nauphoetae TaxID=2049346 RepID=A0ABQ9YEH0_9EUKA|nr:hypothetical protein BLNAU_2816 [Blattamonas nauphoetae]